MDANRAAQRSAQSALFYITHYPENCALEPLYEIRAALAIVRVLPKDMIPVDYAWADRAELGDAIDKKIIIAEKCVVNDALDELVSLKILDDELSGDTIRECVRSDVILRNATYYWPREERESLRKYYASLYGVILARINDEVCLGGIRGVLARFV